MSVGNGFSVCEYVFMGAYVCVSVSVCIGSMFGGEIHYMRELDR